MITVSVAEAIIAITVAVVLSAMLGTMAGIGVMCLCVIAKGGGE